MYTISSLELRCFLKQLNEAAIATETKNKLRIKQNQQQQKIAKVQRVRYHRQCNK